MEEKYVQKFCEECQKLKNDLKLDKTFSDLESGGKEYFYNSLALCVIDAVFSMGARYKCAENAVENYVKYMGQNNFERKDNHTITDFIKNCEPFKNDDFKNMAQEVFNNHQRTSSKNGILKAKACYEVAKKLKKSKVYTLQDFQNLSLEDTNALEQSVKEVRGQSSGIMFSYLCMLAGDENICKPDRWIKRFLKDIGLTEIENDDKKIQELFCKACKQLKKDYPSITPRYLDYQIWSYQRDKDKQKTKKVKDNEK